MELIITICLLLLLAYIFDLTSSWTKIPAIILLLLLGWLMKQVTLLLAIPVPNLEPVLPILGTIGLILIVLEGSLELELNPSKFKFVGKASLVAFLPMILFSLGLAAALFYFGNVPFKIGLANAIPIAVISSAIAIPSARNITAKNKEFVTYESSLSDIFGVIFFNFITLNDNIGTTSFVHFLLELLLMLLITFIATLSLAYLLNKIKHHIKFAPIILMILLIYAVSKIYHLPALIFILLFGLFLNNLDELKPIEWIRKREEDINILQKEVIKFKELTTEIAFLTRALFFLVFGYLIETQELLQTATLYWSVSITIGIFLLRYIFLKIFRLPIQPLLFIAPRGLITILLFLSIPIQQTIPLVNNSLLIQVIILSALVMMFGLIFSKKEELSVMQH